MRIQKATREFERWLAAYTLLVPADIKFKHEQMKIAPFPFLRATFYRWAQVWPQVCPDLARAPVVLSVGDLHVENFGTWRDAEGRLVWGVNDFDEACHLPYTNDLVRLATSAQLAIEANHLRLDCVRAFDVVLTGYTEGLQAGGKPFVLTEHHPWLRGVAQSSLRDPVHFWAKMDELPAETTAIPVSATVALEHLLPVPNLPYTVKHRIAGLGNLGKPRYVAVAEYEGGRIAREAKALVPSASVWARNTSESAPEIFYQAIVDRSVRCRDPFIRLSGHWIVRRLAPDCSRIELVSLPEEKMEAQLLRSMGWETANIHRGGGKAVVAAILRDIKKRKTGWLEAASAAMTRATQSDWKEWKGG